MSSQQAEVIRTTTKFNVGHYCGEMGQDFWDARRWQREFDTKDVHSFIQILTVVSMTVAVSTCFHGSDGSPVSSRFL